MEMKSKLFGFSAKMALAAVAVCGMLTSCYEKEEIDTPDSPALPDPAYVIYGNVTNAVTGEAVDGVTVTIGGTISKTTDANGYFIAQNSDGLTGGQSYTIAVAASGYKDVTRTVYMQTVNEGETCIVVADIALYDASTEAVEAEANTPATKEQAEVMKEAVSAQITELLSGVEGINIDALSITVDENGNTIITAPVEVVGAAVGEDVTVSVPSFTGFASTITPETTFTRAITEAQIWVASAEQELNREYGLQLISVERTLEGVLGKTIVGYNFVITMENRALQFNSREGLVTYQSNIVVTAEYESHDSHDSHDSHNGHGTNPGAGGGDGNSQGY